MAEPTLAKELVPASPDYVGLVDASGEGVGGVWLSGNKKLQATVWRLEWPQEIKTLLATKVLTINDLEMAGNLLGWLVLEGMGVDIRHCHVALLNDNASAISWIVNWASHSSGPAGRLIIALALRQRVRRASPLTPAHLAGKLNVMADLASRSFGYKKEWHCDSWDSFLTLFNRLFPLPNKSSWQAFQLSSKIVTRVTAILQMKEFGMEEWKKLPKIGTSISTAGASSCSLGELTRSWATHSHSKNGCISSQVLEEWSGKESWAEDARSELVRFRQGGPGNGKEAGGGSGCARTLIGEYTRKARRNESKQTVQFRMKDVLFFKQREGRLCQLPPNAPKEAIMSADGATLRLSNQKNGYKNSCIHQEHNGRSYLSPVRALGRRYCHIRDNTLDPEARLSTYFDAPGELPAEVTDKDIRATLKAAAVALNYEERGIPTNRVDTHSLRAGGANALALSGYSDREIMKMGRWRGATFMEYISEQLSSFSKGMSKAMSRRFHFVNVEGGVLRDITNQVVAGKNSPKFFLCPIREVSRAGEKRTVVQLLLDGSAKEEGDTDDKPRRDESEANLDTELQTAFKGQKAFRQAGIKANEKRDRLKKLTTIDAASLFTGDRLDDGNARLETLKKVLSANKNATIDLLAPLAMRLGALLHRENCRDKRCGKCGG
ncbi:hypothetical protein THAOC_00005 [Thalassiosira oceanica]|uniref:Tyr recombinase domain-containing protein n=1 Tax=Thalassiosira oceanica TaxID=159749 RepID=K0THA6_THAOC|nr:hypothetical protein THAOC_00005 [Thalassiosira oceanica]|eukprot:EJK78113.1 hypothetical protein THAOC_00005 [Thalassiosira oceanica]